MEWPPAHRLLTVTRTDAFVPAGRRGRVRARLLAAVLLWIADAGTGRAAEGSLDLSFHGTGWRHEALGEDGAAGMAVQADGKIVMTGSSRVTEDRPQSLAVWRFLPNGLLDATFNGTGETVIVVPQSQSSGNAVAVQGDGRIVVTGRYMPAAGNEPEGEARILLAGLLPDGRPDPGFGPDGRGFVMTSRVNVATAPQPMVLLPDGKLLSGSRAPQLVRYLPDGTPDASFGPGGLVEMGALTGATSLALQSDGRILVSRESEAFEVTRLLPDGALDLSFGTGGTAKLFDPPNWFFMRPTNVAVLPDGKILLAGHYGDYLLPSTLGFVLARLLPNGTPDPGFGDAATPGRGAIWFSRTFSTKTSALAVQSDGSVVVAGSVLDSHDLNSDLALARFTAAGAADPAFGTDGRVRINFDGTSEGIRGMALTAGQSVLVAGSYQEGPSPGPGDILLARFLSRTATALSIEYPAGSELPDAAQVDFGPVTAGIRFVEVVVRNTGLNALTNLQAVLTGESNPGEFHVAFPSGSTLAPGAMATVTVSLAPSAAPGARTAALRITADNTNPALTPRILSLSGSKATPQEVWRVTWFGSPENAGPGADLNDFDGDGLPNFMEYALRSHPHVYSPEPCRPGAGSFTYTRPAAAVAEFSWQPEAAPSPAGPWSADGLTTAVLADDGTAQTVQVTRAGQPAPARLFFRLRVTRR